MSGELSDRDAEVRDATMRAADAHAASRPDAAVVIVLVAEWPAEGGPLAVAAASHGRCAPSQIIAQAIAKGAGEALGKAVIDQFAATPPAGAVLN